ncbi:hypothetical protein ASE21_21415 [Flavobacterium sp. Root901]|uniref:hypothetical protein n=1 Tax=Flavobacterium sp. Root901 TaxID=1736605 RepID=UPI00070A25FA|nr:hypothetical protein [Flavobacterium sp. Root901]KRD12121.1 hypothetical protein ASE21_21415 [Flavobacterium sp. Root901]
MSGLVKVIGCKTNPQTKTFGNSAFSRHYTAIISQLKLAEDITSKKNCAAAATVLKGRKAETAIEV